MSDWWNVDGEDLRKTDAEADLPTSSFEPLPDKTKVLAVVDSAGIGEKDGNRYAEATFTVLKPEGYANRKLFAKYWIFDDNPHAPDPKKKRNNDMRRFVKLDAACGGKLARNGGKPDADDIALAFTGKQVIVHVMLMTPKPKADGSRGEPFNWYADYWPKGAKELSEAVKPKAKSVPAMEDDGDSDVPF